MVIYKLNSTNKKASRFAMLLFASTSIMAIGTLCAQAGDDYDVIGATVGSVETRIISLSDGPWINVDNLRIGSDGNGTLDIIGGGIVNTTNYAYLGYNPGSQGTVNVDGVGSKWTIGASLLVGQDGTGTLNITNGGAVSADFVSPGWEKGIDGEINIRGAGSSLAVNTSVYVGYYGNGALNISDGGSLTTQDVSCIGCFVSDIETISGSGAVTITGDGSAWNSASHVVIGYKGTGALTLTDNGTISTDTQIVIANSEGSSGALNIGAAAGESAKAAGNVISDKVRFGPGTGKIVFNHTNSAGYVFSSNISGQGDVEVYSGLTRLTGINTYTGATTVKGGILSVNGSISGSLLTVENGGTLAGIGSVGNTIIASGGILSPGNSIGTLTINGDLTLAAGSFLMAELAGDGTTDLVKVTGNANIQGSHLVITAVDPETSYRVGQNYTVLSANNTINGTFADVTSRSAFLTFSRDPNQNSTAVAVNLKSIDTEPVPPDTEPLPAPLFSTVAVTNNQFATATALDSLGQTGASLALYNKLLMLSADEARLAFDSMSGEAYASAQGVLIEQSRFINSAITNRLQQAGGGSPTTPVATMNYASEPRKSDAFGVVAPSRADSGARYTGWAYAYGAWSEQDSPQNTGRLKSSVGGFVTGIDRLVYENWRVGLLAGYSRTSFDINSRASSGNSDNYTIGTYTGTDWEMLDGNALSFSSGLAYTWHQIDMKRSVGFPAFSDSLSADYDAGTFQLFGELGYKFRFPKAVIEPYANLSYVRLKSDGFEEDGQTAAALSVHSETTGTTFSTLGLRASTSFDLGTVQTTARGDIGWRHAAGDVDPVSTARFVGSDVFTVAGSSIAKDTAVIEAGLDFAVSKDASLGVSYSGQFGSGAQRNGFNASLKVSF